MVRAVVPDRLVAAVGAALAADGAGVRVDGGYSGARDGDILILAPHEFSPHDHGVILGAADWSWVHLTSAGVDLVDLAAWPSHRLLTRSWQCYAAPLAEYVLNAILTREWRAGYPWTSPRPHGGGLWRASVGIAGWGSVGRRVARVTAALGAQVTVLSRTAHPDTGRIRHSTMLDDILDVDHLVIALPLDATTRALFDRGALSRMRTGLHLVNVSRSAIVDQAALADLCTSGRLAATLDVTDPEPLPADHPLRKIQSVRISPHVAWRSRQSDGAFVEDLAEVWRTLAAGAPAVPGSVHGFSSVAARAAVASAMGRLRCAAGAR